MGVLDWIVARALPITPRSIVKLVARRYIAGETLDDAMRTVERLNAEGAFCTVDVLGEFVKNREIAAAETNRTLEVIEEIHRGKRGSGMSVKLTSLGPTGEPDLAWILPIRMKRSGLVGKCGKSFRGELA